METQVNQLNGYSRQLLAKLVDYLPDLLSALALLVIGWWIIGRINRLTARGMARQNMDVSLRSFLMSLVSVGLKILLLISVAGKVGIQTTSFVAILGAAGLAVGLALQGTLANFAGGVLILIFRPFKVGDVIEAQGTTGVVKEIQIFCTILTTANGKTVIQPNGALSNGTITNVSLEDNLVVEMHTELDISLDFDRVKAVVLNILRADLRVRNPAVGIARLKPGAMDVAITGFTSVADNAAVAGELNEKIKVAFAQHQFAAPQAHSFVHTVV